MDPKNHHPTFFAELHHLTHHPFQWPGETQLESTGQLDIKSPILLPVIFRRILNHCISDGILQGMNHFENLENRNGFDPKNLPGILTYRHLISGHILLIKEVNTLHFLTSIVSPGCRETGPQVSWGSLPKATGTKVSCSKQTDLKEPCVRCARLCRALAIGATKRQWGYHGSAVFHIIPNILWSTSS